MKRGLIIKMNNYNLKLEKAAAEIKKVKAKTVLIQLSDGLKPKAMEISDFLEKETGCVCMIWAGTCFGSCDIPPEIKDVDLCISFGHSIWPFYKTDKDTEKKQTRKR